MLDTISRYLAAVPDSQMRRFLQIIINALADRYVSVSLATAGLVISATKTKVKTGSGVYYGLANGVPVTIAAATDMAALSGTVVNATFNVFVFYIDSASTVTSAMGTAGATLAAVKFPNTPQGKAIVGFVIINPTGTGDFVGGTIDLDDGTKVPNAAYVSPVGAFDPSISLGVAS